MIKARHIVLVTLIAFIIAARVNVSVGEWYAAHLYPIISTGLSLLVSWIPFSITELLVICIIGLIICILIKGVQNKDKVWTIVLREAELIAWIFIWLYLGWGMNYFRESIYSRGNIERQKYDEELFNKFLSDYADSLNYAYTQDSVDLPAFEDDIKSIYTSVPDSFGLCEPKNWQHPKRLLFNRLYTSVGVGGYIGPFFCETHINADLLPYVLSNASRVLSTEEYKNYISSIKPEIIQQLIDQQNFWRSNYNKILGKIQSAAYDSMLKANKIPSGTKNYSQVIELIIATER